MHATVAMNTKQLLSQPLPDLVNGNTLLATTKRGAQHMHLSLRYKTADQHFVLKVHTTQL